MTTNQGGKILPPPWASEKFAYRGKLREKREKRRKKQKKEKKKEKSEGKAIFW